MRIGSGKPPVSLGAFENLAQLSIPTFGIFVRTDVPAVHHQAPGADAGGRLGDAAA